MSLLLAIDDLRKRKKLDFRIIAAHFDHKIRPDSHTDLEFVADFARDHGFELAHGEWKREAGGNLEQNARNARYEFLKNTAASAKAGYVLTAHTMNDQAETFMMNLIRGAGPEGLSGMKPVRTFEEEKMSGRDEDIVEPLLPFASSPVLLARPLLRWAKRRDTENFCLENKVEFRRDPMNEDLNFRRVWVRKVLIPMMEEANPKMVESLCRTSELLSEPPASAGGMAAITKPVEGGSLDLAHLKTLEKADLFPVLRDWIRLNRGSLRGISTKHTEAIYNLIHSQKSGRIAELPGGEVVKHDGRLSWRSTKARN